MEFGFLFWFFFIGIVVATLTDLKRREVDNFLNLFLLVSSLVFVLFGVFLSGEYYDLVNVFGVLLVMGLVMNLFYYGRVFAGGDAKLLFAMSMFFLGATLMDSFVNILVFCFFLMIGGSIYGLLYSGVLWYKNRVRVNLEMRKQIKENRLKIFLLVLFGLVLIFAGFVYFPFFVSGIFVLLFPFLLVFAKGLENVSMVREITGSELREGDWLVEDVVVWKKEKGKGKRVIVKASWDGVSLEDIEVLKNEDRVLIKEGLPFVPAFLIAFLGYVFLRDFFFRIIGL